MERMRRLIPFDSGLFGVGTLLDGVPDAHSILLYEQPAEMLVEWDRIKHQDRVAVLAMSQPSTTICADVEGEIFEAHEAARAHCRRWGIAHVLCTAQIHVAAGLYWVLSAYRRDAAQPFSEAERSTMELIVPHVVSASREAQLRQLRALSKVSETQGQSAAVVSPQGVVLEAEPGFVDLLRVEWPGWQGPRLAEPLRALLGTPGRAVLRSIVVRMDLASGLWLLHVRRTRAADQLTPREREIAGAFSLGETYRELGARFGISPNTARRHLANIYAKLGISSKVELDRMVSDL